jgi:hypothetical protein
MAASWSDDILFNALPTTIASPGTSLFEFSLKATSTSGSSGGSDAASHTRKLVGSDLSAVVGHFATSDVQASHDSPCHLKTEHEESMAPPRSLASVVVDEGTADAR